MSCPPDTKDEKEAVEFIKKLGYRVRKPGHYVKFSSLAHETTLQAFRQLAERLDYRMQEAVTEAFDLWISTKTNELKK